MSVGSGNCRHVRSYLLRGEGPEAARQHAAECPACAELLESRALIEEAREASPLQGPLGEPAPGGSPASGSPRGADALWAGMEGALAKEGRLARRPRSWSTPVRRAAAGAGIAALLGLVIALSLREDAAVLPLPRFLAECAVLALAIAYSVTVVLSPPHRLSRYASRATLPVVALGLGFGAALLPQLHTDHPASLGGVGADLLPRAWACFCWGSLAAALGAGWVWLLLRGPRSAARVPLSLWAVGMLTADLLLRMHCPLVSGLHLAAGHASVGVFAVLVAAALRASALPGARGRAPR